MSEKRPDGVFANIPHDGSFHAGSTMLGGLILYGGLGWLLGRWLGVTWLTPVGILFGAGLSFYVLWFRYGVVRREPSPQESEQAAPDDHGRTDHRPI